LLVMTHPNTDMFDILEVDCIIIRKFHSRGIKK
jgi:hypothetical protein